MGLHRTCTLYTHAAVTSVLIKINICIFPKEKKRCTSEIRRVKKQTNKNPQRRTEYFPALVSCLPSIKLGGGSTAPELLTVSQVLQQQDGGGGVRGNRSRAEHFGVRSLPPTNKQTNRRFHHNKAAFQSVWKNKRPKTRQRAKDVGEETLDSDAVLFHRVTRRRRVARPRITRVSFKIQNFKKQRERYQTALRRSPQIGEFSDVTGSRVRKITKRHSLVKRKKAGERKRRFTGSWSLQQVSFKKQKANK